jgi:tricorn protease
MRFLKASPRFFLQQCAVVALLACVSFEANAQGTRLLREPTASATQIAFIYGGDLWTVARSGGEARRITSTAAVESDPHFSPDGKWIAFTSNRSGGPAAYVVSADGGDPRRLTWSPAGEQARGWTRDGRRVLFASGRVSAPTPYMKLFTIPVEGGVADMLPGYMAFRGSFSPDGKEVVIDRVTRWDVEYRSYRGGQNTPLTITTVANGAETRLPNELTMDTDPVWIGGTIYFLSDRDWMNNVWSYDVATKALKQLTHFRDVDVKQLGGSDDLLVFEQDGYLWTLQPGKTEPTRLNISVHGDFPWAAPHFADVTRAITKAAIGPNGKRALFEARGDIFTAPVDKGDARNLTHSPGVADRAPVFSPDGARVAWFSDNGSGYKLMIGSADGMGATRELSIGTAKMAWNPAWSPDGTRISWVDNHSIIRVIDVANGAMTVADTGGAASDRNAMRPLWSTDSKWLTYAKTFPNQFHRVMVWSLTTGQRHPITDALADATEPVWDRNGKWLYFLASTDLGLQSGWADLGSLTRHSTNGVYVALLRADEPTPFTPESDEEAAARIIGTTPGAPGAPVPSLPTTPRTNPAVRDTNRGRVAATAPSIAPSDTMRARSAAVRIDFDRFDRRILALPMPIRDYAELVPGPAGTVFVAERVLNQPGTTLHKWDMAKRKSEVFASGVTTVSASHDGKKLMWKNGARWAVVNGDAPPKPGEGVLNVALGAELNPELEWKQIYDEAWRIERDFFYASNHHGADWDAVYPRYAVLVPFIKHRSDLSYVIDQVGGELSVAHSFVNGGDFPATDSSRIGTLGADLVADGGKWRIARVYTSESWNPGLRAPLDAPGVKARAGDYLLAVNGEPVNTSNEPWKALDGTAEKQTVLTLGDRATGGITWNVTVVPIRSEAQLRQRAWVEDNRRRVDSLSGGKLAYVWVPNTSAPAITAFDRYYFAQQDKKGAVIDERFNGGGLLDDYMVDIMSRTPVGGITDNTPGARQVRLPAAGLLGPKILLTNELAGSGGDYFPWVFRQRQVGPLIGARTWGGLVNAAVPYPLVDGGTITAPAQAVFGPNGQYIVEGEGVPPDIAVWQDAVSVMNGRDVQLERGVQEALKLLLTKGVEAPKAPAAFPVKSHRPGK